MNFREVLIQSVHRQHKGVKIGNIGDRRSFLNGDIMLPYVTKTIEAIEVWKKEREKMKSSKLGYFIFLRNVVY